MTASLEKLAKTIRNNARNILESKNIDACIRKIGDLFYTGSYALDLMTWNDIDMQVILKANLDPIDALGNLFLQFAKDPDFIEAQMIHFKGDYKSKMPRGIYLGMKFNCIAYGGVWKIDLWALAKEDFEKNRSLIDKLQSLLDSDSRSLILRLKHEMMQGTGRVPQMGSHFLYQAVLLEGIKDRESLYNYCSKHGVEVKK